jgi:hypothetical protein
MFGPPTPDAPNKSKRNPPASAPMMPRVISSQETLHLAIDNLASNEPGDQAKCDQLAMHIPP